MKRICCTALWRALLAGRFEWTPVSEGDTAGPLVIGEFSQKSVPAKIRPWIVDGREAGKHIIPAKSKGFLPLFWCPYCGEAV